jgi:mRNA interferase MazF
MKRGDVVVLNLGANVGKPRPALVLQNDILNETLQTTIVIPFSSDIQSVDTFRYVISATSSNGLQVTSQIMIDKISQIKQDKIQKVIGHITKKQMDEIEARLLAVLGIK